MNEVQPTAERQSTQATSKLSYPDCPSHRPSYWRHGHRYHTDDDSYCEGHRGRILQIMPAAGWFALYDNVDDAHSPDEVTIEMEPLVAWALTETCHGFRTVTGLSGNDYVDSVEQAANFQRYAHESDLSQQQQWAREEALKDYARRLARQQAAVS